MGEAEERGRGGARGDRPLDAAERTALFDALEEGLEQALPGVEILDRELTLDDGVDADLAGVDAAGRVFVALLGEPDADVTALRVLDLLAWVRGNSAVLARHLGSSAARPDQPARLVVVLPEAPARLRRRLRTLSVAGVELLGLRTIQSRGGERVYLTALERPSRLAPASGVPGEAFLGGLPIGVRSLARHAVDRIERLDNELEALVDDDAIAWRFRGRTLVRLERVGDGLRATLGAEHVPRSVRAEADVEALLEDALSELVPMFADGAPPERRHHAPPDASGGFPLLDEPLLTAEEIEAFRD